ncbi:MAG: hypothetical protein WC718_16905 [Phycisphaerales bacterium]|jgi:hypothetical protein
MSMEGIISSDWSGAGVPDFLGDIQRLKEAIANAPPPVPPTLVCWSRLGWIRIVNSRFAEADRIPEECVRIMGSPVEEDHSLGVGAWYWRGRAGFGA